jgi:prolipoprotein diacylglyceryltransferase
MIPYIEIPRLSLGLFDIDVSAILVALAILTGHLLLLRRARQQGFDVRLAAGFSASMLAGGLIVGHVVKLAYIPQAWDIVQREPLLLLRLLNGQASFGGIAGAILGGGVYLRLSGISPRQMLLWFDAIAAVFPFAWFFGRLHCVLVHDHPGVRTDSWLGVRYPDAVRYDLGVLEVLFLPVVLCLYWLLRRYSHIPGFYVGTFLGSYGAFRMSIDLLHVEVLRYFYLSVDQWASLASMLCAVLIFRSMSMYIGPAPISATKNQVNLPDRLIS